MAKLSAGQMRVARIIAKRDNLPLGEASEMVIECVENMNEAICNGCSEEAEDILASDLGLEMDYIFDLLM